MAEIFNAKDLKFDLKQSPVKEFSWHVSPHLSEMVHSKHLDFNIKSLDPGKYSYPYHFHRNSEELFVILTGSAVLRTPDKFQKLHEGDVVFFETGETGAHQLYNDTQSPCVYLDLGTLNGIDVCEYPDSGKINILPYKEIFKSCDKMDYYKDEDNVSEKWPPEIINAHKDKK